MGSHAPFWVGSPAGRSAAATVLDCPSGQKATLTVVTWSDISIADLTSGAYLELAGTFSAGTPID